MNNYKVFIGTGWWCTENDVREERFLQGSDEIRGQLFSKKWLRSVNKYCDYSKIIMIDSASPIKPSLQDDKIEILELPINLGHASRMNHDKYCGWTASVLLSMEYCSFSDADYYVYIEQDVLLKGNIIEKVISELPNSDYIFGASDNFVQPLQQSFFIVKRSAIDTFVSRYRAIDKSDFLISPEFKFAIASSRFWSSLPSCLFTAKSTRIGKVKRRILAFLFKYIKGYSVMNYGYGRSRPINFCSDYLYFQHGSTEELLEYERVTK
ncbi:hypothetical protein Q4490_12300 [Neptunomonas phycophila]|uniref:Glycosyltransferase n=1 Tax=Neptunomonas phycophila TaxID=1572645 RepID=A0AAW7XIV5_9GAMM|nr:hypothetical protein [Neptunomonas phycophila]MDO6454346.1 hypothetical protein [Neptunomonas phycophila]